MNELNINTILKGTMGLTKAALKIKCAPDLIVEERRNICKTCEHKKVVFSRVLGGEVAKCKLCRCIIKAKTLLMDENCPDTPPRWKAIS